MMRRNARSWWWTVSLAWVAGCGDAEQTDVRQPGSEVAGGPEVRPGCDVGAARATVEEFGEVLARVSLLAPDSLIAQQVREEYAPFVTPDLLERWTMDPASAPGREVSSPWPQRIEISSISEAGERACRVVGRVVYVTSTELTQNGAAAHVPVSMLVVDANGWRIDSYEADSPFGPGELPDVAEAADVIRRYYAAVNASDYRTAYELWGDSGAASGQDFQDFIAGFEDTARVEVDVGEPGRVDPAAGSRYVSVPVVINAVTDSGERQTFQGIYTLRQSVVDGASAVQRAWHIYSADIRQTQ